ncbi:MAG: hypothetical protein HFI12_01955 [Lachnospiraceae bacterium]|nr:hypothetical protein [Lachnospiraceae bacterium]
MLAKMKRKEQILQMVQRRMPDTLVKHIEIDKNNHQKRQGLSICLKGSPQSICIYWDSVFMSCGEDCQEETIAAHICGIAREALMVTINKDMITKWEKAKYRVFKKVVNYKRNQERLQKVLHKKYLDLAEVYYLRVPLSEKGWGTCEISLPLLEKWHIQKEELIEQANVNMEQEGYQMIQIQQYLTNHKISIEGEGDIPCYLILNQRMEFAAGVITHPQIMKRFMEQIGSDGYLLPSSVDEFLVVPALQGISPDALSAMVQEVNQTVLSPSSFLSDHVYYCHKETGEVEIC